MKTFRKDLPLEDLAKHASELADDLGETVVFALDDVVVFVRPGTSTDEALGLFRKRRDLARSRNERTIPST